MGPGVHEPLVKIAVKQGLQLVLRHAAAGIRHGQPQKAAAPAHLHRDRTAGRCEFERVGQQLVDQLLQMVGRHGADVLFHRRAEAQRQSQFRRQRLSPEAQLLHQGHHVRVLQRQGLAVGQQGGVGEVDCQPQQTVAALVQQSCLRVQLRVLLPCRRRRQLGRRQLQGAERIAQLRRDTGKQLRLVLGLLFHGGLPFWCPGH